MVIVINGSFGSGKTTVAKLLRRAIRGSIIFDPEWTGFVLMRLPKQLKLKGGGTDDFQDLELWRRSAVAGVRLFRAVSFGPVIVPMTFSNRTYFDEVMSRILRFDPALRVFCLKASLSTIQNRLVARGELTEGTGWEWIARRILECDEAHRDPHFGEFVETDNLSVSAVTQSIMKRLSMNLRNSQSLCQ